MAWRAAAVGLLFVDASCALAPPSGRHGAICARPRAARVAPRMSGPAGPADAERRALPAEASRERMNARLAMLGSAIMFGAYAPAIKEVYLQPGPPTAAALSCARGLMIALPLVPMLWERDVDGAPVVNSRCLRTAAELAVYSFALTTLLNLGLVQGGSATKAAFLLQAAVIFTPCLSLAAREPVEPRTWAGAAMALVGVGLIALDEGGVGSAAAAGALLRLEPADLLFLGTAASWAAIIFRLGQFARSDELAAKTLHIQAAKNAMLALAFGAWLGLDLLCSGAGLSAQWPGAGSPLVWGYVAASALFGGFLGDLLQAIGGKAMPAAEANVILTSEPLWAAALTALFLHERLGVGVYAGGGLLIGAGIVATVGLPSFFSLPSADGGAKDEAALVASDRAGCADESPPPGARFPPRARAWKAGQKGGRRSQQH
ncbi:hypothetical protein KFE25_008080 [Diacronema lutheri]|uniref:EamA domain-containing protein n=2 Tax=Diacronema lutheri TaxID=2081491 RepID=A0A8J6CD27_DIALT|nr:hypothetical protein KFE25_008080 [Diacronema lutheri]